MLLPLADAWLAGWDAARLNKPESVCPFVDDGRSNFASLWQRGWAAGCRNQPSDRQTKDRFIALSLGLGTEMPDDPV